VGRTEQARAAAIAAAIALLGFILPLSFVPKIESLLKYNSVSELFIIYGTSWLLHIPIVLIISLMVAVSTLSLPAVRLRAALPGFFYVSGFLLAVWLGGRFWFASAAGDAGGLSSSVVVGFCAIAGLAAGWFRPDVAERAAVIPGRIALAGGLLGLGAIALGFVSQPLPARPAADSAKPDILLITMDALSNRHLSSMGYPRPTSNGLDAIARRGATFTKLVAASNFTTPTANALLSGRYPNRHWAIQLKSRPVADAVEDSLPARLYAAGYSLRAVGTNPYAGVIKNGYSRYFDATAVDRMRWLASCAETISRWLPYACPATEIGVVDPMITRVNSLGEKLRLWRPGEHFDVRLGLQSADALFQRGDDNRPIFLWVHLMAPHDPYLAPPPFVGRFDPAPQMRTTNETVPLYHFGFASQSGQRELFRARYDESIAATDHEVSQFIEKLQASGRLQNSMLVITADHGESFAADYGGHGGPRLDQAVINIPLIMLVPGGPVGQIVDEPVSQTDIAPTLLELAGVRAVAMDGRSLMPALRGEPFPRRPVFTMELERSSRFDSLPTGTGAIIYGPWKYVHYWGQPDLPGYRDLRDGLYNLQSDPDEALDVSQAQSQLASTFRAAVRKKIGLDR
jgi:arylsulfatase A-like enzyme